MSRNNNTPSRLLVTTGLETTWGSSQDIIFVGEWCKSYDKYSDLNNRTHHTIPFHWSDRNKVAKDYEYIKTLNERVLVALVKKLNKFHNLNKSERYWRIIIGPWLFFFVPILWDRWENIRIAIEDYSIDETNVFKHNKWENIPDDYDDLTYLSNDHYWNHSIFSYILKNFYKNKIKIIKIPSSNQADVYNRKKRTKTPFKSKLLLFLDFSVSIFHKKQIIAFIDSYFSLKNLLKMQISLKQFPRLNSIFKKKVIYTRKFSKVRDEKFHINATNEFEFFLEEFLFTMIPLAHLEGYNLLKNEIESSRQNAQIIFTAISHYNNEFFKVWASEQVEKNSKLFIIEHGEGLSYRMSLMEGHEVKIADKKIVWNKEYSLKDIQLSPTKLISLNIKRQSYNNILLVGYESPIYSYFIQSGALSSSVLDVFDFTTIFINNLSSLAFNDLKIRSAPNQGWNTRLRYRDLYGSDRIDQHKTLIKSFGNAKLIICTYPSTTFSEAMNSNIPTVMIYCKEFWELRPEYDDLLLDLKKNNIVFYDPFLAAKHINTISSAPHLWWNSSEVIKARKSFAETCSSVSKDWLKEWKNFFYSEIKTN